MLKSYTSLVKSRIKRQPIMFAFNVVLGAIVSLRINRGQLFFHKDLIISLVSMVCIALSVYIYNDLSDIEIDRLNKLDRPLVTGETSPKDARNLFVILGIVGFALALTINLRVFSLMLTYFVLYFIYSFRTVRLKNVFLLNKISVGIGTAITYLIGGAVYGEIPIELYFLAAYGFVASLATSVILDFRDVKGDKSYEVKSIPIVWGSTLTIRFVMALIALIGSTMIIGYIQLGFHIAFTILAFFVFATWLVTLYPLFRNWDKPTYISSLVWKRLAPLGLLLQLLTVVGIAL